MTPIAIARWIDLPDREPLAATALGVELVGVRSGEQHSVLHGQCLYRGAPRADGRVIGDDLVRGLRGWPWGAPHSPTPISPNSPVRAVRSDVACTRRPTHDPGWPERSTTTDQPGSR